MPVSASYLPASSRNASSLSLIQCHTVIALTCSLFCGLGAQFTKKTLSKTMNEENIKKRQNFLRRYFIFPLKFCEAKSIRHKKPGHILAKLKRASPVLCPHEPREPCDAGKRKIPCVVSGH